MATKKNKPMSNEEYTITGELDSVARLVHKYYTNQRGIREHNLLNPKNLAQINDTFVGIKSKIDLIPDSLLKQQLKNNYDRKWNLFLKKKNLKETEEGNIREIEIANNEMPDTLVTSIRPVEGQNIIDVTNLMKSKMTMFPQLFQQNSLIISQIKAEVETEVETEVNAYYSCKYDSNTRSSVIEPNLYSPDQIQFIVNSILFFRFLCMVVDNKLSVGDISTIDVITKIIVTIDSYQADSDRRDILEANYTDRLPIYYQIGRYFSLDPAVQQLFTRQLSGTGLGSEMVKLAHPDDEDDEPILFGDNRIYNILFETFAHLVLIGLVFPEWPNPIPVFSSPISVYIGTGSPNTDANCINFKISTIQPGESIHLYAPITSASNDVKVAIKFVKPGGVIIKINLVSGKTFMCVSKSPNEAETFVLAGTYQYIRKFNVNFEDKVYPVYEYNQLNDVFNGITEENVLTNWGTYKSKISTESNKITHQVEQVVISHTEVTQAIQRQNSFQRSGTYKGLRLPLPNPDFGGSKSKSKLNRKSKRRTNKRRNQQKKRRKTKRRTNKRRTNKRRRI
jgi:hypothetical protein